MRLQADTPFGWVLALQTWLAARRRQGAGSSPARLGLAEAAPAGRPGGLAAGRTAKVGEARLRLLRIDRCGVAVERDQDLDWAVLMLDGQMTLDLGGRAVPLAAGDLQIGSAGRAPTFRPGGEGAFLLIERETAASPA